MDKYEMFVSLKNEKIKLKIFCVHCVSCTQYISEHFEQNCLVAQGVICGDPWYKGTLYHGPFANLFSNHFCDIIVSNFYPAEITKIDDLLWCIWILSTTYDTQQVSTYSHPKKSCLRHKGFPISTDVLTHSFSNHMDYF
jgi:hypothetical protein